MFLRLYSVDYKLETYLKIARLYLEDDDPVQGEAYINRASILQVSQATTPASVILGKQGYTASGQHTGQGGSRQVYFSFRFVASKGGEVTDPQTLDLLREAGMQLKARHYFLTLLAHKRVIQGGTQHLTGQHKQGRITSSGRGVLSRQDWLHLSQE